VPVSCVLATAIPPGPRVTLLLLLELVAAGPVPAVVALPPVRVRPFLPTAADWVLVVG